MDENEIINRVKDIYPDALIEVSGADCNFEMYVISEQFAGVGLLQRQQSILALFKDELASGKLHALAIKAKTSQEQQGQNAFVQIQG